MIYWQVFLAFFIPGIIGYGGGPATIPLIENEVVDRYGWMSTADYSQTLALANALPGPIATKLAGVIGYQQAGVLGAAIGLFATVAPSLILMIGLLSLLAKFKDSPRVKRMTAYIRPTIAVLLAGMAISFFHTSYESAGWIHTIILAVASYFLMERWKVHPAFVILGALVYGAVLIS